MTAASALRMVRDLGFTHLTNHAGEWRRPVECDIALWEKTEVNAVAHSVDRDETFHVVGATITMGRVVFWKAERS